MTNADDFYDRTSTTSWSECDEMINSGVYGPVTYLDWCEREAARLRLDGRHAVVWTTRQHGRNLCAVTEAFCPTCGRHQVPEV